MERLGIVFHWKERAESCERTEAAEPGGPRSVVLKLSSGLSLTVDEVLVAAGRASNTGRLNLEVAGVKLGDRGLVLVDDEYRTNVPHIFAAGDVIGFPALASTSMDQARGAVQLCLRAVQRRRPERSHAPRNLDHPGDRNGG